MFCIAFSINKFYPNEQLTDRYFVTPGVISSLQNGGYEKRGHAVRGNQLAQYEIWRTRDGQDNIPYGC